MTFLSVLGVMELLCSFRLVLEGKTGKRIPQSSRIELLANFWQIILLYQVQILTPLGHVIEEL